VTSQSVEGIWQALKVFQNADVDPTRIQITTMFGLRRTEDEHGPLLGHRAGLYGTNCCRPRPPGAATTSRPTGGCSSTRTRPRGAPRRPQPLPRDPRGPTNGRGGVRRRGTRRFHGR
jgi:hypothetical protein